MGKMGRIKNNRDFQDIQDREQKTNEPIAKLAALAKTPFWAIFPHCPKIIVFSKAASFAIGSNMYHFLCTSSWVSWKSLLFFIFLIISILSFFNRIPIINLYLY